MTAILLAYDDMAGARDHFVDRLGFTEDWSISDATDVTRAHVRLGDTLLMLDRPPSSMP
jgi:hypothetical protein